MSPGKEIYVDKLILESFTNEHSAYYVPTKTEEPLDGVLLKWRRQLRRHINHSLSERQKQVMKYFLAGKKEREIAQILGIKQQVVNIYKHRAIKKLHKLLAT